MNDDRHEHLEQMRQLAEAHEQIAAVTLGEDTFDDAVDLRLTHDVEVEVEIEMVHLINAMGHIAMRLNEVDNPEEAASMAKLYVALFEAIPDDEHEMLEEMKKEAGGHGVGFGVGFQ